MKRAILVAAALISLAVNVSSWTADPLVGVWQLDHQELNGQKKETEQLTLRISPDGDKLAFAFSVPVNNIDFVSLSYSTKLDGTEAEVKNARGEKIGTVQITTSARSHYKMVLKGANHPDTTVQLSISADGKMLTSDSDSTQAAHSAHLVQTFLRR
jgi:hypothetical protein